MGANSFKADSIDIEIKASADSASKALDSLVNRFDKVSKTLSTVGTSSSKNLGGLTKNVTSAKKSFGGLASAIGRFYATYFLLIRAIKGISGAIEDTANYIEAFNYFTVSMGKIASKWDSDWENYGDENARNYSNKFFTTLSDTFKKMSGVSFDPKTGLLSETGLKNLGLNLQEVTQYAAQLSSMMDAVGQSGETTLATTNAFVKLAGDISSLYNIDYSDAAGKIRSVLQGQSRAGYAFGWDTTMASLQNMADKLNLSKAVSEMSQMEKQQLRILTIFEQSRVAYGDQSNTINTLANQMRIFKNNVSEAGMMLGQLFLPILTKLMPIINGVTIAIKRLLGNIAVLIGIKIEDIGQGFTDTEEDFENITDEIENATNAAKEYKNQLMGFDEINKISDNGTVGNLTVGDIGTIDLTEEILKATKAYEKAYNEAFARMENKAQEWADKLAPIFDKVTPSVVNLANAFINLGKEIGDFADSSSPFVTGYFSGFTGSVATTINNIATALGLFNDKLEKTDNDKLEETGRILGEITTAAIGLSILVKVGNWIVTFVNGIIAAGSAVLGFANALVIMYGGGADMSAFVSILALLWDMLVDLIDIAFPGFEDGLVELNNAIDTFLVHLWNVMDKYDLWYFLQEMFDFEHTLTFFNEVVGEFFNKVGKAFEEKDWASFGLNIILGILSGIVGAVGFVVEPIYSFFEEVVNAICDLFGIHSPAKNMEIYGKNILLGVLQGFTNAFSSISKPVTDFYNKIKGFFDKEDWNFGGIKDGLKTAFDNAISAIKKVWNAFADGLNAKLTFKIDPIKVLGKTIFAGTTLDLGNIPKFATGGFPEDGLFMANHGELVGQFSNGRTAVANNEQIIKGIEAGVYRAVTSAMYNMPNTQSGDIVVNIDGRQVFRAVKKQANNYTTQTGLPAF